MDLLEIEIMKYEQQTFTYVTNYTTTYAFSKFYPPEETKYLLRRRLKQVTIWTG